MMDDSQDYEDSILAGDRSEAVLYYDGFEPSLDYTDVSGPWRGEDPNQTLGELLDQKDKTIPNRSSFVSTDVKDAILLMMPSLNSLVRGERKPGFPGAAQRSRSRDGGTGHKLRKLRVLER